MHFSHHPAIWSRFPTLAAGVLRADGLHRDVDAGPQVATFEAMARERLDAVGAESELPEIQAWRRTFSALGLKPTQYRCASESLLRRFRKEGALPGIHPLIDLCNAASLAFAIPVAALDAAKVEWPLQVRFAAGDEDYLAFSGEHERPDAGEVTFADAANRAHARRWTHRQSGLSAVRDDTREVLVVAEALHETAGAEVARLVETLAQAMRQVWGIAPATAVLSAQAPAFSA
jgi:DNA/RNA-binding domain of Phe-tRNA-synthetase-like protein